MMEKLTDVLMALIYLKKNLLKNIYIINET